MTSPRSLHLPTTKFSSHHVVGLAVVLVSIVVGSPLAPLKPPAAPVLNIVIRVLPREIVVSEEGEVVEGGGEEVLPPVVVFVVRIVVAIAGSTGVIAVAARLKISVNSWVPIGSWW